MNPYAVASILSLYPNGDHHHLNVSLYAQDLSSQAITLQNPQYGVDLRYRRLFSTNDPDVSPTGEGASLRFTQGENGGVQLDQLKVESFFFNVNMRPQRGDIFEMGLLLGSWDEVWLYRDSHRVQFQMYSPVNLNLIGLSKNQMDDDNRLKYFISAGAGLGTDLLLRAVGRFGIHTRLEGRVRSINRHLAQAPNSVRHELSGAAELGISWLQDSKAWQIGGWLEHITRWEPRDAEGRDGIDQQYFAGGVQLSARFYKRSSSELEPDLDKLLGLFEGAEGIDQFGNKPQEIGPMSLEEFERLLDEPTDEAPPPPNSVSIETPPVDP